MSDTLHKVARALCEDAAWLPVVGWPHYEVSTSGLVRKAGGDEIGQWTHGYGYRLVRLSQPRSNQAVHRLVAMAFLPNPCGKPSVNHIDNNSSNNRAENLEWCTQAENIAHMDRQGRRATPKSGIRPAHALLSDEQVRVLRAARADGAPYSRLAADFGVSKRTAMRCVSGEYYANVR